jgi:hypothetical protein
MSRVLRRRISGLAALAFALLLAPTASCANLDPRCECSFSAAHDDAPGATGEHPAPANEPGDCHPLAPGVACGLGCAGALADELAAPRPSDARAALTWSAQESALPRAAIPPELPPPRR